MTYIPHPIDTSAVTLPEDIRALGELLARNTHENFVQLRLQQGWVYGAVRDDLNKTNPTLVPYDQLPEAEREYDRRTATEALKTLLALGYSISPSPSA